MRMGGSGRRGAGGGRRGNWPRAGATLEKRLRHFLPKVTILSGLALLRALSPPKCP